MRFSLLVSDQILLTMKRWLLSESDKQIYTSQRNLKTLSISALSYAQRLLKLPLNWSHRTLSQLKKWNYSPWNLVSTAVRTHYSCKHISVQHGDHEQSLFLILTLPFSLQTSSYLTSSKHPLSKQAPHGPFPAWRPEAGADSSQQTLHKLTSN